jgi:phenylpropionate dioxygenase-like ring-hydroxylating dioxygenase large terminal subunit
VADGGFRLNATSLRFWHPVARSSSVRTAPIAVKLCGTELVLFRDRRGQPAALEDRCPHRKMRLSRGCVSGDRIVCPYHSWSFGADGYGKSPGNPSFEPRVQAFEVAERNGYCWVRLGYGERPALPAVDAPGYELVHAFDVKVKAPFRLLMDNMAELEHTASVHEKFGFGLGELSKVNTETRVSSDKELEIYYDGPQRPVPRYLSLFAGLRGGDHFVQLAVIRFGPVYATYELTWTPPGKQSRRPFALRFVIFYNPVDDGSCEQFTFVLLAEDFPGWLRPFVVPILRRVVEREIRADIALVEGLTADAADPSLHQLGRFDRPLVAARQLIQDEYFGYGRAS